MNWTDLWYCELLLGPWEFWYKKQQENHSNNPADLYATQWKHSVHWVENDAEIWISLQLVITKYETKLSLWNFNEIHFYIVLAKQNKKKKDSCIIHSSLQPLDKIFLIGWLGLKRQNLQVYGL